MPSKTELPTVPALLKVAVHALGGKERSNQLTMASAVAHSIDTGEHLAVQAGTGTGKSLAYLVPSIRHAVESGKTVVVSTATIALQRQLVDRDLPRLSDALAEALGQAVEGSWDWFGVAVLTGWAVLCGSMAVRTFRFV